jgi:hypothetical protein
MFATYDYILHATTTRHPVPTLDTIMIYYVTYTNSKLVYVYMFSVSDVS